MTEQSQRNTQGEEDSFGVHRGLVPRTQVRLALIQPVKDRAGLRPLSLAPVQCLLHKAHSASLTSAGVGETRLED